ncbi:MAG TPA: CmpA/NrtA family ABC transporter substrate-binding protein [Opitutaceae bacterium]|nr:CmpA/NrtA family ABC transporter substrate-binding protein [Opitutaceae bacterium]
MTPADLAPFRRSPRPLRVGFVALTDAAPLAAAQELGLFRRHGLRVQLSREVGWSTIREKVVHGELDAAPAPAPMLWSARLGLDCAPCPVLTALVLNLHGNAITLSTRLREAGVGDAAGLRAEARRRRGERRLTLGVVFPFSSHALLLRQWLRAADIDPERDLRIVVVPPAQMFGNLQAGTLDGYCAGEPWGTVAVQAGAGWCPAWSASLWPGHVEKVLMVREAFALDQAGEHLALVAALAAAAAWCDEPRNRTHLAEILSDRAYLNLPVGLLLPALTGRFDPGTGREQLVPDFHVFAAGDANVPTAPRFAVLQDELVASGLLPRASLTPELPRLLFREDLHRAALAQPLHAPQELPEPGGVALRQSGLA